MFHYPVAEHKGEPKEERPEGIASGKVAKGVRIPKLRRRMGMPSAIHSSR